VKTSSFHLRIVAIFLAPFLPTGLDAGVVTNVNDSGPGSLRQVIADEEPGGIISFAPGLNGQTIILSNGPLEIDKSLFIDALELSHGINITKAPESDYYFLLNVRTSGVDVNFLRVNLIDSSLGAIRLEGGNLWMADCEVTGNFFAQAAGGILVLGGNLTMNYCLIANNGSIGVGGLEMTGGTAVLNQCTVSGNESDSDGAGGISVSGGSALALNQCTVNGNVGSYRAGAIDNSGTLNINQSTITGNSGTGAGGIYNNGDINLTECTVAGNASTATFGGASVGGILQSPTGELVMTNTIVAGNTGSTEPNVNGTYTVTNSLVGGDPLLAPLGDYGGLSMTMPPLPGSPALNVGGVSTFTTDQRDRPRLNGLLDIGAAEAKLEGSVINLRNNGDGSLRQIVKDVTPGAVILFDSALADQTIPLLTGQILLDKDVTIDASSLGLSDSDRRIRIDGGGGRIFEVAEGVTVVLKNLALFNGQALQGGCVFNHSGNLTVNHCVFFQSSATNLGGAIYNFGPATVENSTFFSNSADLGGAICTSGSLSVNQSTFFSNIADAYGGGIAIMSGNAAFQHVTVSRNEAQEGGGIKNYATLNADNTLVAGNTATTTDPDISGPFSGSNNLTSGDPRLALLGDYGGPTLTMLPLAGSPAIDAAGPSPFTFDQRGEYRYPVLGGPTGYARTVGPAPDIGAVESGNSLPTSPGVVDLDTDVVDGLGNGISLREAVILYPEGVVIGFAPDLSGRTIHLTSGQMLLERNVGIDASVLPAGIAIAGNGQDRLFEIPFGVTASLKSLVLENGGGVGQGGAILNAGSLTLDSCWLHGNSATLAGGAIHNNGSSLNLSRSTVSGNSAPNAAGIENFGSLTAEHCTITLNNASSLGGGVFNYGFLSFNHCTLTGNSAMQGAGIYGVSGFMDMNRSILGGNVTQQQGSDLEGSFQGSENFMASVPLLAPLGSYGGMVPSMPPLPGSPVIDSAFNSSSNADQRGLPILGLHDIGASEFQGNSDVGIFWNLDFDNDGVPFGVEQALGTDLNVADLTNIRHLAPPVLDQAGSPTLAFGLNPDAVDGTVWILSRSQDLVDFDEIYRFDGTTDFPGPDSEFVRDPERVVVTDTAPPAGRAFYRFEARHY
jgi:hypothetical protein